MKDINMHGDLILKKIDVSHLKQYNELLRYVFQVTAKDLLESGYEDGELVRAKKPILESSYAIGWFQEDTIVSQLSVYPWKVNIHGKIFEMGGLTGVGTYPEYAGLGLMGKLIKNALENMRMSKQWISYLYPYSIPYYRKKGWEIINDHISFTLKDTQLPKHAPVSGFVERHDVYCEDVKTIYNAFSKTTNGVLIREEIQWDEYWRWEDESQRAAGVYYNEKEEPIGYLFYWIEEEVFYIKEMICLDSEAWAGLWNFVSAHISMVDEIRGNIYKNEPLAFLLEDGQISESIEPYYMARVVDVEEFLKAYPFAESSKEPFHFIITDPIADWNNRVFGLNWGKDGLVISDEKRGESIITDIQTFTSLFMSYRSPEYFSRIERLHANKNAIKILGNIIPKEQPWFSDYF